jgi:hypothetical protein
MSGKNKIDIDKEGKVLTNTSPQAHPGGIFRVRNPVALLLPWFGVFDGTSRLKEETLEHLDLAYARFDPVGQSALQLVSVSGGQYEVGCKATSDVC